LILENDDGQLVRRTFTFEGYRIRMVSKEPYTAPARGENAKAAPSVAPQQTKQRSVYARIKDRVKSLFRR
jgi:hypothetical protein